MNLDVCGDTPHHRRTTFSFGVLKGCGLRGSGNQCDQRASGEKLFAQRSRRHDFEIYVLFARSPATHDGLRIHSIRLRLVFEYVVFHAARQISRKRAPTCKGPRLFAILRILLFLKLFKLLRSKGRSDLSWGVLPSSRPLAHRVYPATYASILITPNIIARASRCSSW
jgi:hypothetical protein